MDIALESWIILVCPHANDLLLYSLIREGVTFRNSISVMPAKNVVVIGYVLY